MIVFSFLFFSCVNIIFIIKSESSKKTPIIMCIQRQTIILFCYPYVRLFDFAFESLAKIHCELVFVTITNRFRIQAPFLFSPICLPTASFFLLSFFFYYTLLLWIAFFFYFICSFVRFVVGLFVCLFFLLSFAFHFRFLFIVWILQSIST